MKKTKAEAAEEKVAAAAAAMKMNRFLPARKPFWRSCGDVSVRTQKRRKWSSFGHCFGHCSELPFTFGFLRCVNFVHDINLHDECLQIQKSGKHVCQKSSFFV